MPQHSLQLLIVDGLPAGRQDLRDLLARSAFEVSLYEADTLTAALAACQSAPPDCVLLADQIPDAGLADALAALRDRCAAPIVLIAAPAHEDEALAALDHGADDYLLRGVITPGRLGLTIRRALAGTTRTIRAELEAARHEALEAQARIEALLNSTPNGIAYLDRELRYQLINPALAALNGRSPAEHIGRTMADILPLVSAKVEAIIRQVLETGEPALNLELHGIRAPHDGLVHDWMLSYFPVRDPDGAVIGVGSIVVDITPFRRAQVDLVARAEELSRTNADLARALRLKDEFLAIMSHELRTPLTIILGVAESLTAGYYGPIVAGQQQALATLMQSGRHLLAMLSDILGLAQIEAGNEPIDLQPLDMNLLCQETIQYVEAAAQEKGVGLTCKVEPLIGPVRADERHLTQILVSLLDNAVKFTPGQGMVGLEVAADHEHERIQLLIWDTGIGIDPAHYDRLFQPFSQVDAQLSRRYSGVGLGLTLVRRLVELHGGSVSLESEPGQGSRFIVRLPWAHDLPQALAPLEDQASPPPWSRPPRLLLADDHEPTLARYREALTGVGCVVVAARSGEEALEQARATRPDVVVLDWQMPRIDGLAAIRRMRADDGLADTRVIVLTALAMPGDRERCLAAGADAYLPRPVGPRALIAVIAGVLGG